jgi:peptidyl-prolyl cis-trans isomerase SurA
MINIKKTIAIILMLSVILITGCSTLEQQEDTQQNYDDIPFGIDSEDTSIEEHITVGVVATVNNEEITSDDVTDIQQTFLMQGMQISEEEAIEQLINQKVLELKVKEENIVVTNEEAEVIIEQQLLMQNMTLDEYKEVIESQGVSYEEELESIKDQIAIQIFLENKLEGKSFDVTEEEAKEFYEMYKLQMGENEVPSYEEIEPQIIASLEQEKQQEEIDVIIQDLILDVDIEYK